MNTIDINRLNPRRLLLRKCLTDSQVQPWKENTSQGEKRQSKADFSSLSRLLSARRKMRAICAACKTSTQHRKVRRKMQNRKSINESINRNPKQNLMAVFFDQKVEELDHHPSCSVPGSCPYACAGAQLCSVSRHALRRGAWLWP